MDTFVYVDGFNFYYGAMKGTTYKWLDFMALFGRILPPHYDILRIKYFTARVSGLPDDPRKPDRQDAFLKALEAHIPEIEIHYGNFTTHDKWFPLTKIRGPTERW